MVPVIVSSIKYFVHHCFGKIVPHVNHVELKLEGSGFKACYGRKVEDQDTLPVNKAGAFHIDGHIYINVCGFAHMTGAVQGDPNSGVMDLNGWNSCQGMDKKCVVEYAFDPRCGNHAREKLREKI